MIDLTEKSTYRYVSYLHALEVLEDSEVVKSLTSPDQNHLIATMMYDFNLAPEKAATYFGVNVK